MQQRRIQRRSPGVADHLPTDLHPVLRRVYCNRGVGEPAAVDLGLAQLLPFASLKGIDAAVGLLMEAREQRWRICVVGDYDADGATSTALLASMLPKFGMAEVEYLLPDRFRYGYGLSPEIVELAQSRKPDLLITVDNGIASFEGVTAARSAGIRVLITDHHLPGQSLPQADAIVNPNQPGCDFPSKALAGVGVAFYLLLALRAQLRAQGAGDGPNMASCLDLVALGTVADVVPLDHNNRILVEQGLRQLRSGRGRAGIRALLQIAGRDYGKASAADLGFTVGPRLNAAGRLEDMSIGVECLLSTDEDAALKIAHRLDQLNRERREIQQEMQDEALAGLAQISTGEKLPVGLCVYDPGWHQGVTGLVAGKVKDRHHRPVVAFAPADERCLTLKGSARSIPGFHIRDALDAIATRHPGLIAKFGGHAMAAGLSLEHARLEDFRSAFDEEARRWLDDNALEGVLETDGPLTAEEFSLPLAEALGRGGPWGQGFPEPVFEGTCDVLERRIVGERHLKLKLRLINTQQVFAAIAFNRTEGAEISQRIRLAFRLVINDYRGQRSPEAVVEYLEEAG
jgi:single-stranded-DNA-specific exonuclease